jgi:hypothetical protein
MEGECLLHFSLPSTNGQAGSDHFRYLSAKCLHNGKEHQIVRHISFVFDSLCRRVVDICPGAGSVLTCEQKEGGSNRVLIFAADNAKLMVAKLLFANAGPRWLVTQSEVATIQHCEQHCFFLQEHCFRIRVTWIGHSKETLGYSCSDRFRMG